MHTNGDRYSGTERVNYLKAWKSDAISLIDMTGYCKLQGNKWPIYSPFAILCSYCDHLCADEVTLEIEPLSFVLFCISVFIFFSCILNCCLICVHWRTQQGAYLILFDLILFYIHLYVSCTLWSPGDISWFTYCVCGDIRHTRSKWFLRAYLVAKCMWRHQTYKE
jgi:hypothetical protein